MRDETPIHATERDPNLRILHERVQRKLEEHESHLHESAHAIAETLRAGGLRLLDAPFRTNHGEDFDIHPSRHLLAPPWAVDGNGRLHKSVGGRWIPQSNFSVDPPSPTYVVRTS